MTTRLFVIRHGETEVTQEDRFAGSGDQPLSATGRDHVCGLSTRLSAFHLDAVYSSPLRRAVETANIIAEPHGVLVSTVDDLLEINHGHWEGMTRAEVQQNYPDEYAAYESDPLDFHAEGGEPAREVAKRAVPAMQAIVRAHPNQQIALVSHKTTNRLLIGYLLGIDLRRYRELLGQRPACLSVLDFSTESQAMLSLLNDVSHYEICAPSDGDYIV